MTRPWRKKMRKNFFLGLVILILIAVSIDATAQFSDANYSFKRAIRLDATHSLIDTNYTFRINADSDSWPCFDTNSIAIVWQSGTNKTQLNADVRGTCGGDMNIYFKNQFNIAANTSFVSTDNNGYFIYTTTKQIASAPRDYNLVYKVYDGFEDGSVTDVWSFATACAGTVEAQTAIVAKGLYAAKITNPAGAGCDSRITMTLPIDQNYVVNAFVQTRVNSNSFLSWRVAAGDHGINWDNRTDSNAKYFVNNSIVGNFPGVDVNTWYYGEVDVNFDSSGTFFLLQTLTYGFLDKNFSNTTVNPRTDISFSISTSTLFAESYLDEVKAYRKIQVEPNKTIFKAGVDFTNSVAEVNTLVSFTDDSNVSYTITSWTWRINGTIVSTSQNFTNTFTSSGDFNVSLVISDGGSNSGQRDEFITVGDRPTTIDISFITAAYRSTDVDINFTVSFTPPSSGTVDSFIWGFPGDQNLSGQTVTKNYTTSGTKVVCVTLETTTDINTTGCETFFLSNILLKIPKNESTNANITPYNAMFNTIPAQDYSSLTADQNFWIFFQGPMTNTFNIDANSSFYPRQYIFDANTSNLNFILQPYLVEVANGIQTILFTIDDSTRTNLPNIRVEVYRDTNTATFLVESGFSDVTGTIALTFLANTPYTLKFYSADGNFLSSGTIVPVSTTIYAFIFTGTFFENLSPANIQITWSPFGTSVDANAQDFVRISQLIQYSDTNINSVSVFVTSNDLNIFTKHFSGLGTGDWNVVSDVNVADVNAWNLINVRVVIATTSDGNFTFMTSYVVITSGQNLLTNLREAKTELGGLTALILAIIITLTCTAFVATRISLDPTWLGIFTLLISGMFVYVDWIPFDTWAIAALGGVAIMTWGWRR